ncbi:hypothetical protein TSA66_12810 [Noviherbaspirillum autotrophicum]|uniref:Uncharacterized protein n=1 Tax=Noviherbaspirillum autotrophicum TaxID=709839 RepID=A0A0C1Y327_9BURK|nr:hypothetical protein TSA66_12810 [Noviherbaspirillum autotrophicum]
MKKIIFFPNSSFLMANSMALRQIMHGKNKAMARFARLHHSLFTETRNAGWQRMWNEKGRRTVASTPPSMSK